VAGVAAPTDARGRNRAGAPEIFTIGHSNHAADDFVALLRRHAIATLADVRSTPASRRHPWFGRARLEATLRGCGIAYAFLGDALGARPADPALYRDGRADFARMAATPAFGDAVARLVERAGRERVALLCAEREPLDCHRALLVARSLADLGLRVRHILADGRLESHADTEERLLALARTAPPPLLATPENRRAALEQAYALRGRAIAYARPETASPRR
jgi:uncharacterized protein (DUF488 family)